MKRIILLLIFISNLILLPALQLDRFYNKNYEIADRSVFVFDKEPNYFIEKTDDAIIITINRGSLTAEITDLVLENNPVISSYAFSSRDSNLRIVVKLNRKISDIRKFGVEEFVYNEKNEYKLVLDVSKYETLLTKEEYNSQINFYNLVGLKSKAVDLEKQLELLPEEEEVITDESQDVVSETQEEANIVEEKDTEENLFLRIKSFIQNDLTNINIMIAIILILAVFILIIVILNLKKKARAKDVFHDKEKLGSKSFRIRVIKILQEAGWDDSMIAEELGISLDEVKNGLR